MRFIIHITGLAIAILLTGCGTTRICSTPYQETESQVLNRLGISKQELTQSLSQSTVIHLSNTLTNDMSVGVYRVQLNNYEPNDHISFLAYSTYDIGANGGEYIDVSIEKAGESKTKVSVDYSDRAAGCCIAIPVIPFAYINPGFIRERNILRDLLAEERRR